jgi:hypothetical protein
MINGLQDLQPSEIVGAIICVGIATFGVVDAAKSAFSGIDRIGFSYIEEMVKALAPESAETSPSMSFRRPES